MFAVIGQKITSRLKDYADFVSANGDDLGSELIYNGTFSSNINNWWASPQPPRGLFYDSNSESLIASTQGTYHGAAYCVVTLVAGETYFCEYTYNSTYQTSVDIGSGYNTDNLYQGVKNDAGTGTTKFSFTATQGGAMFLTFNNWATSYGSSGSLSYISLKSVSGSKIFPVIIPQGIDYPATTYEISGVGNFMSKGSSLNSCDVSINIACFADSYATTYNQAKAVVEALDLYEVTYTEDEQSYIAKFRFINLDDEYYKKPEVFYKNLTFNCLIIKN